MPHPRLLLPVTFALLCLAGCATKPTTSAQTSYVAVKPENATTDVAAIVARPGNLSALTGGLAGRTLDVTSLDDVKLQPREVILTFDDGPVPGKTERILATLDTFGVKATFLMVGEMAKTYPDIAQLVQKHGHAIGSHTYRHANLQNLNFEAALAEINRGKHAVENAIGEEAHFFRFPYLADTKRLRTGLKNRGDIVLDVDVDSKDYFKVTPDAVIGRTMATLRDKGQGIILMHDIHTRTETMLPELLKRLRHDGYRVVTLRFGKPKEAPLLARLTPPSSPKA